MLFSDKRFKSFIDIKTVIKIDNAALCAERESL